MAGKRHGGEGIAAHAGVCQVVLGARQAAREGPVYVHVQSGEQ